MPDKSNVAVVAGVATVAASAALLAWKTYKKPNVVEISLPPWLHAYEKSLQSRVFRTDEEMMEIAVEISARNVQHNTGGPFGCVIFERDVPTKECRVFSVGANRVTALNNSSLHGEMVAIQFAEKKLQNFTMRCKGVKEYLLFTSCEPCAMCLGGTLWSGVGELVCAASKADAEAIGFNEGPVFEESYKQLEAAGIRVKRKVLQPQGAKVLQEYGRSGIIYNS